MESCCCNSKSLYRSDYNDPEQVFVVDGKQYKKQRKIFNSVKDQQGIFQRLSILDKDPIFQSLVQSSDLWVPSGNQIDKISWDQIQFNPLWFYKQYISKNVPCVITDVMQGDDIYERWADPQYLQNALQNYNGISMSLTPDGFADSVRGQYFIEPEQIKTDIKKFLDYKEYYPNSIPYIQHQNSSLTEQMWMLNAQVDQQPLKFLSKHLFNGSQPDAQNIWMGYDDSVSSLHKDSYQNFYTTITGEKHFTLLPPIDILYLEQQVYKKAKWSYSKENSSFSCHQIPGQTTNWVTCNPDLEQDLKNQKAFPWLSRVHKFHVVLQKSQMLYLPSMWYHQVSQRSTKDPYTVAINYWFDMQFSQNYSLYEICRKLKGL